MDQCIPLHPLPQKPPSLPCGQQQERHQGKPDHEAVIPIASGQQNHSQQNHNGRMQKECQQNPQGGPQVCQKLANTLPKPVQQASAPHNTGLQPPHQAHKQDIKERYYGKCHAAAHNHYAYSIAGIGLINQPAHNDYNQSPQHTECNQNKFCLNPFKPGQMNLVILWTPACCQPQIYKAQKQAADADS